MSQTPSARPPVPYRTKLLYAVGSVASSVKQRTLSTFLLIFYNQVVGLPPAMVSMAIMFALIFDAIVDPLVGQWSDNTRTRWGRRHPFMYAAALPVSIAFFLIWNPPQGLDQQQTFLFLIAVLLTIRFFDTFFELPSSALVAELARGYDERTQLISLRTFFGMVGGLGMVTLAYQVFLREHSDGTGGVLARDGYFVFAVVGALVIFATILIAARGTHSQIPYLKAPPARSVTFVGMAREVGATLNNRSFVALTIAGMAISIGQGMKGGLEIYFNLYYWELTQTQLVYITTTGVVASLIGVLLAPKVGERLGKRNAAIFVFVGAVLISFSPVFLRVIGLAPANHTPEVFWLLMAESLFNGVLAVMTGVFISSMMADVVEDAEVRTGRRSEGLLFSAENLFRKLVSGVGVFVAGAMLTVVSFPQGAERGQVDPELLRTLAIVYLPTAIAIYGVAVVAMCFFQLNRKMHENNLDLLSEREIAAASSGAAAADAATADAGRTVEGRA